MSSISPNRRRILKHATVLFGVSLLEFPSRVLGAPRQAKRVAVITTVYRKNSHADVIAGKILEGWNQDGGDGPQLEIASMYVDQFPDDDLSRKLSKQFGFPIYDSIDRAITLDEERVAVDGIISIGEHGDYPWNKKGQHLYPRRRFFRELTDTLHRYRRVVPVFNDKHPGPEWDDALWMYDRAKRMRLPWMAGSSLPVSFRDPDVRLPWGSHIEACLGVGYSGLDIYGFHTLDFLQCFLERRRGGETGVRWVQCLPINALNNMLEDGSIHGGVLDAALAASKTDRHRVFGQKEGQGRALFLIQYQDGLLAPVLMLPGTAQGIAFAFKVAGGDVQATRAEERSEPRYPHFAYLLKGIEQMIHTGEPAYPVERTMLSAGMLDRLLTSRTVGGKRIQTPELLIQYAPRVSGCGPDAQYLE